MPRNRWCWMCCVKVAVGAVRRRWGKAGLRVQHAKDSFGGKTSGNLGIGDTQRKRKEGRGTLSFLSKLWSHHWVGARGGASELMRHQTRHASTQH
mmetsp:Transcript_57652/g.134930  ORF Transcript_57652/g.134930 Transcript_57652/m.134930 type:complete len:95 (-) Transcript_57652:123-407(-)